MDMYRKALALAEAGAPFAFASVVSTRGSTPQKAGSKALFERAGAVWGTLGGGCLEAESRRRALQAMDTGQPDVFYLNLDEDYGWDDGLICGGKARIFVNPDVTASLPAYAEALAALGAGGRGALLTYVREPGGAMGRTVWVPEASFADFGFPGGAALRACLEKEACQAFIEEGHNGHGALEVFAEPVRPSPKLLIAGGGHVGKAAAHWGAQLGFEVTVVDDRPIFANAKHIPSAHHTICGDIAETVANFPTDADTYILIVTRGHRHDHQVLARCIKSSAAYIGMIGSRRKSVMIRKAFLEEGLATEAEWGRVHSPVGLDIGAVTVEEIAGSIAAQLVAARRGRLGAIGNLSETVRP